MAEVDGTENIHSNGEQSLTLFHCDSVLITKFEYLVWVAEKGN